MTALCHDKNGPKQKTRTKKHDKSNRGQFSGCKKQQSSVPKPGIPPARIPEITKSSHSGMTYTLTLWSKHRQRRVATKVVRRATAVKQESETWSSVKMTAKLRHSGRAQSPLSFPFASISIRFVKENLISIATLCHSAAPCCVLIQSPNVIDTISKRWQSKKPSMLHAHLP